MTAWCNRDVSIQWLSGFWGSRICVSASYKANPPVRAQIQVHKVCKMLLHFQIFGWLIMVIMERFTRDSRKIAWAKFDSGPSTRMSLLRWFDHGPQPRRIEKRHSFPQLRPWLVLFEVNAATGGGIQIICFQGRCSSIPLLENTLGLFLNAYQDNYYVIA